MKFKIIIAVAVLFTIQATAQLNTFRGAGFEVSYPTTFRAFGSQKSSALNAFESAFFISPDNSVEFYIFAPLHNGLANDIAVKSNEKQSAIQTTNGKATNAKFWTITAKDNSYERTYQESIDVKSGDNWIIGLKYKNQAAFAKYRNEYLAFKKSYRKTSATNAVQSNAAVQKLNASFVYEEKDDPETGGTLTTIYLLFNDNKSKIATVNGSAEDIEKPNYPMSKVPSGAIAACGSWYGGTAKLFYVIQKGDKLVLYTASNAEDDPKLIWQKVKEF